jgi:hypothetical protein
VGVYNLFTRELRGALATHGAELKDLQRAPLFIHKTTIQRLVESLDGRLRSFPTLPPEHLQTVIKCYHLTPAEVARLKAAMLASWVGLKLLDRVPLDRAMYVVEQLFALLVPVLQDGPRAPDLVAAVQKGVTPMEDAEFESLFAPIAARYDQATLALNMSYEFGLEADRVASARHAHQLYQEALAELRVFPAELQRTEYWEFYNTSIRDGDTQASTIIQASEDSDSLG